MDRFVFTNLEGTTLTLDGQSGQLVVKLDSALNVTGGDTKGQVEKSAYSDLPVGCHVTIRSSSKAVFAVSRDAIAL